MSKPIIFIRDGVYVPNRLIDVDKVREHYTVKLYEDKACIKCEYFEDRHSYICDTCPAFLSNIRLYKNRLMRDTNYTILPIGDKRNFSKVTKLNPSDLNFFDKRVEAPFTHKIRFTATLRDYQLPLVDKFLHKKYGLIEAPPRTGKTIILLYLSLKLQQRTLILADQYEFLKQFEYHIEGHKKSNTPKCTNLPELQDKYGVKLYGVPECEKDYKTIQIFLMTYQSLASKVNGKPRFDLIKNNIGTVAIDEVHKASAPVFSKVISSLPSKYKFGVTGTVTRKDKKHVVIKNIIGPIVASTDREALIPIVYVHETGFKPKSAYNSGKRSWVFAMLALSKSTSRNSLIVDYVMKDLESGHSIVIPLMFKKHIFELSRLINEAYGSKICETFVGGSTLTREKTLERVKAGKIRVVVGTRKLIQLGLNVPQWSAIYTAMPISNEPNYKQETSRVRTPLEGKKQPLIRIFTEENLGQSIGCTRNCLLQCMKFKYKLSKNLKQKAIVSKILNRKRYSEDPEDVDPEQLIMVQPRKPF